MSRPPRASKSARRPPRKTAGKPTRPVVRELGTARTTKTTKAAAPKASTPRPLERAKKSRPAPRSDIAAPGRATLDRWTAGLRSLAHIPGFVYLFVGVVLVVVLVPTVNWVYQVARKPSELFFPVSDDWYKTPSQTWRTYGSLFVTHSTPIMAPELLAALAQQEASGNPVARTYWRWSATSNFFEIYRPASSAVGMYQFTDGTFDEARRYCIRNHRVVADGPWYDWQSCWFNKLYARVIPSHAVELAASNLDRRVREILARKGIHRASLRQQQELAIITHLCGAGAAARYAARGLQLRPAQRCGAHDPREYVARVMKLAQTFARLRHAS